MKRLLSVTLFLLSCLPLWSQTKKGHTSSRFTIEGTLSNDSLALVKGKVTKLYLKRLIDGVEVAVDSALVKNKSFRFQGVAPKYAEIAFISGFDNGSVQFILEAGKIVILPFDARYPLSAKSGGTVNNDVFRRYKETIDRSTQEARKSPLGVYQDKVGSMKVEQKEFYPYQRSNYYINSLLHKTNLMKFLKEHLDSPVALFVIRYDMFYMFTPKVIERQYLRALPKSLYTHPMYAELVNQIKAANLAVGKPAPDIEGKTQEKKVMKLSDLRGKYVLLDFWASWCAPCRKEFPVLKEALAYAEKSNNFAIYSFSLDNKEKEWIDCIGKNNLVHKDWLHLTDLKAWNSEAVKLFNVTGVPRTVLLSPSGKVIAFDLRGEELLKKVKRIVDGEETYE